MKDNFYEELIKGAYDDMGPNDISDFSLEKINNRKRIRKIGICIGGLATAAACIAIVIVGGQFIKNNVEHGDIHGNITAQTGENGNENEDDNQDENADEESREMTQEELDEFTEYARRMDVYGFLMSEYTNPSEVNLEEVFYSGAGFDETMSDEEIDAYLAACNQEELYTDCVKIDRSYAKKLVEEKLGLDLEDFDADKIGIYIPEYDAYYHECGDTNYFHFTCVGGYVNGNIYTLEFTTNEGSEYTYIHVQTVLEKTENGYRFISNKSFADSRDWWH